MKIEQAEFVLSAQHPEQFPRDGLPEVAFVGRSNVGKSTLLNRLLNRKSLARTSSTPGRTRAVNYFLIDRRYYFVDLPGYGFAKAAKHERQRWAALMNDYFRRSPSGRSSSRRSSSGRSPSPPPRMLLVQLIDGKVGATNLDLEAHDYFRSLELSTIEVATKIDKVPRGKRARHLEAIRQSLELPANVELVPFSAVSGEGVKTLWSGIAAFLDSREEPSKAS